jgi:hypothetical protein
VRLIGFTIQNLNATLIQPTTNTPVPNQVIVFTTVKGQALCSATTNANGVASCHANVPLLVGLTTLLQGYNAAFAGNPSYGASSAHGRIGLL